MPSCSRCGGEIVFRKDRFGRPIPIHLSGGCFRRDFSRGHERPRDESACWKTSCPKCRESVWFVRHNGGSVWLDEIGVPWPKHACFDDPDDRAAPALQRWIDALRNDIHGTTVLAIVKGSRGSQIKVGNTRSHSTSIDLTPFGGKPFSVRVSVPLTANRGELICWAQDADGKTGRVVLSGGQAFKAEVVSLQAFELLPPKPSGNGTVRPLVTCPRCNVLVRETRLERHLTKCPVR